MLRFIDDNTLEGVVPASDCEKNLNVKWLSGTPTGSFYIGDSNIEKKKIAGFLTGKHACYVDSQSFFQYLDDLSEIVHKFKHMFFGPVSVLEDSRRHFERLSAENRYIFISYTYPDRYLKTSKFDPNVREFKFALAANITNIRIEKSSAGEYTIFVNLVENWRDEIMAKASKCTVNGIIEIFDNFVDDGLRSGKDKIDLARLFGIKYAGLLRNNGISIRAVIDGSTYADDSLLEAAQNGMKLSQDILWESKFNNGLEDSLDTDNDEEYVKFKNLLEWFVKQLRINNDLDTSGKKTSGQGYAGDAIRALYKDWREYIGFALDCNMSCGYDSAYSGSNYINVPGTGMNIRPVFDKTSKEVTHLYIDLYNKDYDADIVKTINAKYGGKRYDVGALGLFDGQDPNELLKELFDDYKNFIEEARQLLGQTAAVDEEIDISSIKRAKRSEGAAVNPNPLNVILYGPPGTGKTYSTTEYAVAALENRTPRKRVTPAERGSLVAEYQEYINKGQIVFTTFHQNYGYEDFIEGLRPAPKNGMMDFKLVKGRFKELAEKAIKDQENNYVMIIDEINRGNISKIFGDLITLLEEDKRWGEENQMCLTLPSGKPFAVPNNLYIIGTMNSADKSIALIDTALRRRFDFIEVAPDPDLVIDAKLKNMLIRLNEGLKERLGNTDLLIGHAYFIGKGESDLAEIMNRKIIPLLYEYFYDQTDKVRDILSDLQLELEDSSYGRIKIK